MKSFKNPKPTPSLYSETCFWYAGKGHFQACKDWCSGLAPKLWSQKQAKTDLYQSYPWARRAL